MTPRDVVAALSVAVVWGATFVFIKWGVAESAPTAFTGLRFLFAAIPAVFFLRPPRTRPILVLAYGLLVGVGHFGLLFYAFSQGMTASLASVVVQWQAFFTVVLAWVILGERPTVLQSIAIGLALLGIASIGSARLEGAGFWPFFLTIAASSFWAGGNIVGKIVGPTESFSLVVWSSLIPPLPMFALAMLFDRERSLTAIRQPSWLLLLCVVVVAYAATLFGFGVWSRLLTRVPAAALAPFMLMAPLVGMTIGKFALGEALGGVELLGAGLVLAGLLINVFGERWTARRSATAG